MAPERSLLPPTPPSQTQCTSNVIGIVPPSIHSLLSTHPNTLGRLRGGIDQNSSGISFVTASNEIWVWEHSVQTLNEELVAPPDSLRLVHPHRDETRLKVACVSPRRKGAIRHVYAASPSGTICLWIVDSRSGLSLHRSKESEEGECDAFLSFELEEYECLTCLTAVDEWILASTSKGRVYKVRMTSRPLGLHAKLIQVMEEEGIVKGLYNKFFTPKKSEEVEEGVIAIFPFWKETREAGKSPPPRKMPRLSNGYTHLLSISESLLLTEWRVSLLPEDSEEGRLAKKRSFRRRPDGTLDLDCLGGDLEGYTSAELVDATCAKEHLLAIVRLSSHGVEDTRLYVVRIALGGEHALSIVDSVWLDRYCGEDIAREGGLECFGCVAGDEEGVAYVGFGPRGRENECPVTISAIHFGNNVRIKDMDLFHHMVPSIVLGCMGYDSTTGGCLFLAASGLLGGASVRFPRAPMPKAGYDSLDMSRDESVSAIKSHLLSAFRQYVNKLRDGSGSTNHASIARSVVPPSINGCSASVLSAAAVMASQELLTNTGGGRGGWLSPSFKLSSVAMLREKLQLHTDFVNFLLHAGAYRKVSPEGRVKLRDHGEMIVATQTSFVECQGFLTKLDDSVVDAARREEAANIRRVATKAFEGVSDSVVDLPSRWAGLQQATTNDNIWLTSFIVCNGIGRALRYRHDESTLYDVPVYEMSMESSSAPWTSSSNVLQVLHMQLQNINQFGESLLDNSSDLDADTVALKQLVEDMSAALLGGHRDIVMRDAGNENMCQMYENAKQLSIPLLRSFANDDGDDLVALSTSLTHEHFQGIVQICHDHRKSWMYRGPFSDKEPNEMYDLRLMLRSSTETQYTHLHNSIDFETGLDFCSYVLGWYSSKGLKSKVFELGKECPGALAQHLRHDRTVSELSWINDLQIGSYENATNGLLNSSNDDLWGKETSLSLAKLANKLAVSMPNTAREISRTATIDDGLTLTYVQRSLQAPDFDHSVMSAKELISLAINKVKSAADIEARKGYVTCGLQAASTMSSSQKDDSLSSAASVWEAAIQSDMQLWKSLAQKSSMSVSGIPDNVLTQCEKTVFVGVCIDLASADAKMRTVGFLTNPTLRQRVGRSLGLDENMDKLLMSSAQVACS